MIIDDVIMLLCERRYIYMYIKSSGLSLNLLDMHTFDIQKREITWNRLKTYSYILHNVIQKRYKYDKMQQIIVARIKK